MVYLYVIALSSLLISAQALWASTVKANSAAAHNGALELISKMLQSPKVWLGAVLYVLATLFYFLLLSKVKFFSVQISMTGLAIILSTLVAVLLFHEKINATNIAGMLLILLGLPLVLSR